MFDDKHSKRSENDSPLLKPLNTEAEECSAMHALQKFGIEHAHDAILTAHSNGMIDREHLEGKIIDFGCGSAGSTWVLDQHGADIIGVDILELTDDERVALGDTQDKIITTDGIQYLRSLEPGSLDMVTAFMLGPDMSGEFLKDFYEAANHALKPTGRLLLTSEVGTLSAFIQIVPNGMGFCDGHVFMGLKSDRVQGIELDPFDSFATDLSIRSLPSYEKSASTQDFKVNPDVGATFEKCLAEIELDKD